MNQNEIRLILSFLFFLFFHQLCFLPSKGISAYAIMCMFVERGFSSLSSLVFNPLIGLNKISRKLVVSKAVSLLIFLYNWDLGREQISKFVDFSEENSMVGGHSVADIEDSVKAEILQTFLTARRVYIGFTS